MKASELNWTPGAPEVLETGMLLRYKSGRYEIVGDINENGGTCSCCYDYAPKNVEAWTMLPLPEGVSL